MVWLAACADGNSPNSEPEGPAPAAVQVPVVQDKADARPVRAEPDMPTQTLRPPPRLAERFPGADIRPIAHVPMDATPRTGTPRCTVTAGGVPEVPEGLALLRSSPDGANHIYGPAEHFRGGDHNVFGEVDGVFTGEASRAVILAPGTRYDIDAVAPFGFWVGHSAAGDVQCTPVTRSTSHGLPSPEAIGLLRQHVHDADIRAQTRITLTGNVSGTCLSVREEDGREFVAVFPDAVTPALLYAAIYNSPAGSGALAWLPANPSSPVGVRVTLDAPLVECGGLSEAVLFRDAPAFGFGLLEFADSRATP